MNILAAIRREERKLEKQVGRLQKQLDGLRAAANADAASKDSVWSCAHGAISLPNILR